jgi:subfamily B ATP-binding cassette protein MsbA
MVSYDLRKTMYNKIIELPISYYSEKKIMARMLGDVNEVQTPFLHFRTSYKRTLLIIFFALGTMFIISTKLTLFVLIFMPISGWIISKLAKNLRAKSLEAQKESGQLISIVDETLGT